MKTHYFAVQIFGAENPHPTSLRSATFPRGKALRIIIDRPYHLTKPYQNITLFTFPKSYDIIKSVRYLSGKSHFDEGGISYEKDSL